MAAKKSADSRLADDLELEVIYSDDTPFGGLPSGRLLRSIRERCASVFRYWSRHDGASTVRSSAALLAEAHDGPLGELFAGPGELRREVLYPPAGDIRPEALVVRRERREIARARLTQSLWPDLARWIGDWSRAARRPASAEAAALFDELAGASAFGGEEPAPELAECDGHFVGHATVAVGGAAHGRIVIDPYLLPRSPRYPRAYQPIVASQLTNLAAVCITHSHADHFSIGSLLRLGAETRIIVPRVARESALSVAMAARLAEIGFSRVEELGWGEQRELSCGRVVALPFFGEQPTTGRRLHPEVRNEGNTYLVEVASRRYLAVADSGRDAAGDAAGLAETLRGQTGALDVLFGGYRSFPLYPIEYLPSSVPQYLLFVLREEWLQRQKIMYDADELVDLAERWAARHLVPYACGGAPWYWQRGLGPELDGDRPANRADPAPEVVLEAARWRTGSQEEPHPSPIDVVILRPGDGFRSEAGALRVMRGEPHAWPYSGARGDLAMGDRPGERARAATAGGGSWLQFNVALNDVPPPHERERDIWRLLRRVVPVVTDLKALGRCRRFFYQCKPPGLRLRIELGAGDADASPEIRFELERARAAGAIRSYAAGVYEPEWRAFGGLEAMAAVHGYFDADTSLMIERLGLGRSTMPCGILDARLWLAFVSDDLVVRCVGERGECWDVYAGLLERHTTIETSYAAPLPCEVAFGSVGEHRIFERYRTANGALADALDRLSDDGKLGVGRRQLVGNVVQFQFNRYDLSVAMQQAVLRTLLAARDPEGAATGAPERIYPSVEQPSR